jgi:hypothetical protein
MWISRVVKISLKLKDFVAVKAIPHSRNVSAGFIFNFLLKTERKK